MQIRFISQASIFIKTSDTTILTDPWYLGTAFNDAWKLFPASAWDNSMLDEVEHLWISHEHPDHFHIATLKSFPQSFKDRVTLLFQKNNSDKMPNAFKALGFKNIQLLNNRKVYDLTAKTKICVTQIGQMDSSLAIINEGTTVLNLNDCEANANDCRNFLTDLGKVDIVLNQFSMAGYNGHYDYENHLPQTAVGILKNMVDNHRDLNAKFSIPFASNLYFCQADNKYMNDYGNTPNKAWDYFKKEGLGMIVLYAGDTLDTDKADKYDSSEALAKYDRLYTSGEKIIDTPPIISLPQIADAVKKRHEQMSAKFPTWLYKKLGPVKIFVPDLNKTVNLNLSKGQLTEVPTDGNFDLEIWSQPLFFAFNTPWGVQTMGVGARFRIKGAHATWKWYRILTSLNNAEMFLKMKYLLTKNNFDFIRSRMKGGMNQLFYQLQRMSS